MSNQFPPQPPWQDANQQRRSGSSKDSQTWAIVSLVLAVLSFACLGPVFSIPALIVGIIALRGPADSQDSGTRTMALIGSVLAAFNLLMYLAVAGLYAGAIYFAFKSTTGPHSPTTSPTPPLVTTTPPPAPSPPRPRAEKPVGAGIQATSTTVTQVGTITVVDLGRDVLTLREAIERQQLLAARKHQRLVLQTTSPNCRPCLGVATALPSPAMQKALAHVRLVRVDVRRFHASLQELGIPDRYIPGFFLLDARTQSPVDGIHGGEWDEDTAENIAPVLGAFLRGKLTNRRDKIHLRKAPRGTML